MFGFKKKEYITINFDKVTREQLITVTRNMLDYYTKEGLKALVKAATEVSNDYDNMLNRLSEEHSKALATKVLTENKLSSSTDYNLILDMVKENKEASKRVKYLESYIDKLGTKHNYLNNYLKRCAQHISLQFIEDNKLKISAFSVDRGLEFAIGNNKKQYSQVEVKLFKWVSYGNIMELYKGFDDTGLNFIYNEGVDPMVDLNNLNYNFVKEYIIRLFNIEGILNLLGLSLEDVNFR